MGQLPTIWLAYDINVILKKFCTPEKPKVLRETRMSFAALNYILFNV